MMRSSGTSLVIHSEAGLGRATPRGGLELPLGVLQDALPAWVVDLRLRGPAGQVEGGVVGAWRVHRRWQ